MRLTCPNCETAYEVPAAQIPEAGRHVQCTSCHTRWFARREPEPEPSEDQIIRRLEARPARPRPTVVATPAAVAAVPRPEPAFGPAPAAEPEAAVDFVWESPRPAPAAARARDPAPVPESDAPPPPALVEPAPALPVRPADLPRPRPLPDASEPVARPEGRRPASHPLRLDLAAEQAAAETRLLPRSRFGRGLFVALLLCALALVPYLLAAPLADRFPGIAPWIADYVEAVDALRETITPARPAP